MSEQSVDLPEGFGTTNYSDSKYQTWKLPKADGSLLLRPLPPMKSMQGRPGTGLFWRTHFGWSGRDPQNPSKTKFRPFLCLEEKRDGMVVQQCPACELRRKHNDKINLIKAKGKEMGKTEAQIKTACAPHEKWLRDHGLDGKVRIPCVNKQGQVGIFLAPYGIFIDFRDKCRQLNQKGHDPAGPKGIFFEFIRTGPASPKSDSCEPHRISKEVDGETVEKLDFHVLTRELGQAALDNIPDLNELMEKGRISLEKIEQLCAMTEQADGTYDPGEVDRILGVEHRYGGRSGSKAEDWLDNAEPQTEQKTSAPKSVEDDEFEEPAPKTAPKTEPTKTPAKEQVKKAASAQAGTSPDEYDKLFG